MVGQVNPNYLIVGFNAAIILVGLGVLWLVRRRDNARSSGSSGSYRSSGGYRSGQAVRDAVRPSSGSPPKTAEECVDEIERLVRRPLVWLDIAEEVLKIIKAYREEVASGSKAED